MEFWILDYAFAISQRPEDSEKFHSGSKVWQHRDAMAHASNPQWLLELNLLLRTAS